MYCLKTKIHICQVSMLIKWKHRKSTKLPWHHNIGQYIWGIFFLLLPLKIFALAWLLLWGCQQFVWKIESIHHPVITLLLSKLEISPEKNRNTDITNSSYCHHIHMTWLVFNSLRSLMLFKILVWNDWKKWARNYCCRHFVPWRVVGPLANSQPLPLYVYFFYIWENILNICRCV